MFCVYVDVLVDLVLLCVLVCFDVELEMVIFGWM